MTFETLQAKLKEANYNVSLAAHQLEIAESMATIRPCPLVEKSIAAFESAVEKANEIRIAMGKQYESDLLALDKRCGRK